MWHVLWGAAICSGPGACSRADNIRSCTEFVMNCYLLSVFAFCIRFL